MGKEFFLTFLLISTLPVLLAAQDEDEDEFPPGLLARYTVAGKTVEQIDPDLMFDWGEASPDPRLPVGPFTADWSSLLLVRQASTYTIHAYLQGEVSVAIGGQQVLSGKADEASWITGKPFELGFGEKSFSVKYRKNSRKARLQLFWSSDAFALEPIPANLFFRESGNAKLSQLERGRVLYDSHRCNRCHRRTDEQISSPAPSLKHIKVGMNSDWLLAKLQSPSKTEPHFGMPSFGFSEKEAVAVATFLMSISENVKLEKPKAIKPDDMAKKQRSGEVLLRSVGCFACHRIEKYGNAGSNSGGDLTRIGEKRTYEWIYNWLWTPQKLNADHLMPLFKLSSDERVQLALVLSRMKGDSSTSPSAAIDITDEKLLTQGKKLVEQARCVACHQIPGIQVALGKVPNLSKPVNDWSNSCLHETSDRTTGRPSYQQIDKEAIQAYLNSRVGKLSADSEFVLGLRILERRNCLACHERDHEKGIREIAGRMARVDEALKGHSEAMIPPALTAVGDKLQDAALIDAVAGQRKSVRMPWLHIRMPRFQHSDAEKAALLTYFTAHDRIPADAPQSSLVQNENPESTDPIDPQSLVLGHTLVGPKGFSCVACHKVGKFEPKNVALGTRGSDLLMLGKTMRRDYFIRWCRSPLRIVPGMEMPSYTKAVPSILDGNANTQLLTIWNALNDARFKAPTNPSSVEQFFVVRKDAPARIVRDVFTNPEENGGGAIARSFAIGLNNGHNVLFDLDSFSLRQWTFGDLARQRTVGKSWYWDMAGVPVITGFDQHSDFAIVKKDDSDVVIIPHTEHGINGRLIDYKPYRDGVTLNYALNFIEVNDRMRAIDVSETITPVTTNGSSEPSGWSRRIEATSIPKGFDLLVAKPTVKTSLGSPTSQLTGASASVTKSIPVGEEKIKKEYFVLSSTRGTVSADLEYRCSLKHDHLSLKTKPAVPVVIEKITSVPGYEGSRLPISRSIMPTAFTWLPNSTLAFTSLKGDVYIAKDSDGDGLEDQLSLFEEGLASPYGIIADGEDLIVSHKPELVRLRDTDGDGRADHRTIFATGWGYDDNYHDWVCGIVRDSQGKLYVGLGSDYAQGSRPKQQARWRGKVLQIDADGKITPVGHSFRYPTGLAINAEDQIFVTDNQGVQNTFNEFNHLVTGNHYGVPSRHEPNPDAPAARPAVQIPHPWTRSVNGVCFLNDESYPEFAGHAIGCEYDSRFLVRFSLQKVGDVMQGASYYFSRPNAGTGGENFNGPLSVAVDSDGDIYIGSIHDSGWLGGQNTGSIARLKSNGKLPNGIQELRAVHDGFELEFIRPIDSKAAAKLESYTISGYTRIWKGGYATPDSGRYRVNVQSIEVANDSRTVTLHVDRLQEGYVYEVSCGNIGVDPKTALWPQTGHYTMNRVPSK